MKLILQSLDKVIGTVTLLDNEIPPSLLLLPKNDLLFGRLRDRLFVQGPMRHVYIETVPTTIMKFDPKPDGV